MGRPDRFGGVAGCRHRLAEEDDSRKRGLVRPHGTVIWGARAAIDPCRDDVEECAAAGVVDLSQELQIVGPTVGGERIELGEEHDRIRIGAPRGVGADCQQRHVSHGVGGRVAPVAWLVRQIPELNEGHLVTVPAGERADEPLVRGEIGGRGVECRRRLPGSESTMASGGGRRPG